jgi:hypothetical protein
MSNLNKEISLDFIRKLIPNKKMPFRKFIEMAF